MGLADGPNVYGYVRGNPIRLTDPSGYEGEPPPPHQMEFIEGPAYAIEATATATKRGFGPEHYAHVREAQRAWLAPGKYDLGHPKEQPFYKQKPGEAATHRIEASGPNKSAGARSKLAVAADKAAGIPVRDSKTGYYPGATKGVRYKPNPVSAKRAAAGPSPEPSPTTPETGGPAPAAPPYTPAKPPPAAPQTGGPASAMPPEPAVTPEAVVSPTTQTAPAPEAVPSAGGPKLLNVPRPVITGLNIFVFILQAPSTLRMFQNPDAAIFAFPKAEQNRTGYDRAYKSATEKGLSHEEATKIAERWNLY